MPERDVTRPFAILRRSEGEGQVELLELRDTGSDSLAGIRPDIETLTLVPQRAVAIRGLPAVDDGTPLLVFEVTERHSVSVAEFLASVVDDAGGARDVRMHPGDEAYARRVDDLVASRIAQGDGANFVVRRDLLAELGPVSAQRARGLFARLLSAERGAFWTFVVWTGEEYLLGASPEQHLGLTRGVASMTPISGTMHAPDGQVDEAALMAFLADDKEVDELYMVLDEELKMMTAVCTEPPVVTGPRLRAMSSVVHTEYTIGGPTDLDVGTVLERTLLAPTIIGSPLHRACAVVAELEPEGRGYYGGVLALSGPDPDGLPRLDSCILIRSARISAGGSLVAPVGATVVRRSTGEGEARETRSKAEALVRALTPPPVASPARGGATEPVEIPAVATVLRARNDRGAPFWQPARSRRSGVLRGIHSTIVDAGDDFTQMLAAQLEHLGCTVRIVRSTSAPDLDDSDLVVLGPGPGNPADRHDAVIGGLREWAGAVLSAGVPTVAVCLSHQVIARTMGFDLARLEDPHQGRQLEVDFMGIRGPVGFYNSFTVVPGPRPDPGSLPAPVELSLDEEGRVIGMVGRRLVTMQFHPESFLTLRGPELLERASRHVMGDSVPSAHVHHQRSDISA